MFAGDKAMSYKERYYPETRFGGFSDIDGTVAFYARVNALARPDSVVLDFGCGRGVGADDAIPFRRQLRQLRGKVGRVVGVDVDESCAANPLIDEFCLITEGGSLPLRNKSVDICLCDAVLEHLRDPATFFAEIQRVLRPGGYLCIRTSNSWSYIAVAGRLVPNRYHGQLLARVQNGRRNTDVFPTFYKCNTIPKIRQMLRRYGFCGCVYGYSAEPSYAAFSGLIYALLSYYGRESPSFLRDAIFVFAQRT